MSTPSPTTITCIYCRQVREPTREHVLPRSLGGDFVQPILCGDCNSRRLSPLDQALAERSLVALSRIGFTPKAAFDVRLGGDHFVKDEATGLMIDVALTNEVRPVVMPQVHVAPDGSLARICILTADTDSLKRLDAFVMRQINAGRLSKMYVKLGPSDAGPYARLVMHRENDGYLRAQTAEDAQQLVAVLQANWQAAYAQHASRVASGEAIAEGQSIPNPSVHVNMSYCPDDVNRAIAKIVLNVLAARVGSQFALAPEFDELRRYILGEDIRHPERLAPDQVAVDSRFVLQLPHGTQPIVPTDEHAVTLFYVPPSLYGWVTLYGSHNFIVKLGEIALSENLFAVHEFSSIRRGNEALDISETYKRIRTVRQDGQE
ncbi:hypothetical protein JQX13_53145 [Archangium violaceum]|nr:hypothetical protein JQX13_53145 [Archangium violaceum]